MKIVRSGAVITKHELQEMAEAMFGNLVKAVVDVEQGVVALGGELHADEETLLLENGSQPEHLWGINLYPAKRAAEWIEFDSVINLKPAQGNRSRDIEDAKIRKKIVAIIERLVRK